MSLARPDKAKRETSAPTPFAVTLLSGPTLMALLCAVGAACGYHLGVVASFVIVAAVAIALGVALARILEGFTASLAVVAAMLAGGASAYGFHLVHELETGAFVRDVALADLPTSRDKTRLTLREGVPREDLFEIALHTSVWGSGSTRQTVTTTCEAYPIVPKGWSSHDGVSIWRFGDPDTVQGRPIAERVFRRNEPDDLCREAIGRAIATHRLTDAPQPIYLEAMVSDSADADENRYKGVFAVALLGGLWIVVALYVRGRDALGAWRRRRESRRPHQA